jgi:hypothetical protein
MGGGGSAPMAAADPGLARRIEALERKVDGEKKSGVKRPKEDNIEPRIIKDKGTKQIKLEETLIDYMEIIISLNAKVNSHIQTTKVDLQGLESKLAAAGGGTYLNGGNSMIAGGPEGFEGLKGNQRLLHIETELEKLRLDVSSQKENDKLRQDEMESFFKKASLEYFNKLRETSEKIDKMKQEQASANNVGAMVELLEQEVIDLKNRDKTRTQRGGGNPGQKENLDTANRIDLILEELNQLWSFSQRFIDEQATDMVLEVTSSDYGFKDKMNRMGWLARNAEFLSPD